MKKNLRYNIVLEFLLFQAVVDFFVLFLILCLKITKERTNGFFSCAHCAEGPWCDFPPIVLLQVKQPVSDAVKDANFNL